MKKIHFVFLLIFLISISLSNAVLGAAPEQLMSPYANGKERVCLDCHRFPNIDTNEGVIASRALCMECHEKEACKKDLKGQWVSVQVGPNAFGKTPHKYIACIECHVDVAKLPHRSEQGAQCLSCHTVHGEKEIHDPHLRVRCQACHRMSKFVLLDKQANEVRLSHFDNKQRPIPLTNHLLPETKGNKLCQRCHFRGNKVGAAAAILPSKSVICLMCHTSPIAMGNSLFWIPFLIFVFGILSTVLFWFKGSVEGEKESLHRKISIASEKVWQIVFSREFFRVIKVFVLDVILQRKILQESVRRWGLHSFIYLSILIRFGIAIFTLVVFNLWPSSSLGLALINKNNPFTAFVYDLLGLFILIGICWALIQRFIIKPKHVVSEFQDSFALILIGLIVLVGFKLEAMRILITQIPPSVAMYSFVGYPLSRLLSLFKLDWSYLYQFIWYSHAVLSAVFIAYLPFGKMKHIINTPFNLLLGYKKG